MDATNCYLFFQRLAAKVDLINTVVAQTHNLPESLNGPVSDVIVGICEMRGRLSSIGMIFQVSGPQLGDYEAAQLAAYTGTRASFIVGGLGAVFAAGWYWLRGPALRDYEYDSKKAA